MHFITALHHNGVIHGDAVIRNALFRERDGQVLWIDFEFATVINPESSKEERAQFARKAQEELEAFDLEIERREASSTSHPDNNTSQERIPSQTKTNQGFASCCCTND